MSRLPIFDEIRELWKEVKKEIDEADHILEDDPPILNSVKDNSIVYVEDIQKRKTLK